MIYTLTLNPAVDYVMRPLTLDMGITNRSSDEEWHIGGNGLNIAQVLKELDVGCVAMGIVGGFTGDYILEELQDMGITCNFVKLDRGNTRVNIKLDGIVMTMVNGVGPKVPQSKLDELLDRLRTVGKGDTLVLTGSIPSTLPDTIYDVIMSKLQDRGIRFVVDAPGQELIKALPRKPFLIKPNNHEVGRLFGTNPETPEEVMPYARLMHEQGAQNVIVSCGGHGSALIDEYGNEHICLSPRIRLVNATGAGDSMVAGFLAAVDSGATYDEALRFASCCGSATAASRELAKRPAVEKLLVQLNERMDAWEAERAEKAAKEAAKEEAAAQRKAAREAKKAEKDKAAASKSSAKKPAAKKEGAKKPAAKKTAKKSAGK